MQRGRGRRIQAPTPVPSIGRFSEGSESATSSSSIVRRPGWSDSDDYEEPKSQVSMSTFLKRYEVRKFIVTFSGT